MYIEYNPHILLSPYIDKYWVTQAVVENGFSMKVFPDGCVDIIFAFGSSARNRSMTDNTPYLVGTVTSFLDQHFSGTMDMFGIRFKPGGITAFLPEPQYEFTDEIVELSQTDSLFSNAFCLSIPDTNNRQEQIAYIEKYMLGKLSQLYRTENRILHAVEAINRLKGTLSMKDLAGEVCLSPRQFERRFKSAIGMSPKMYSRIVRFNHSKNYLAGHPGITLYSASLDCGYYDYAHMIKEFAELAGEQPGYFISPSSE